MRHPARKEGLLWPATEHLRSKQAREELRERERWQKPYPWGSSVTGTYSPTPHPPKLVDPISRPHPPTLISVSSPTVSPFHQDGWLPVQALLPGIAV